MSVKRCRMCGNMFSSQRSDAEFCSPKCVAQHYRVNPDPQFMHAENHNMHRFYCEQCTNAFEVNDYAFRGGKRRPKYCSNKCKQAAYRARGQSTQQQAKRRSEGKQQSSGNNQQSNQNRKRAKSSRMTLDEACIILGCEKTATGADFRKAYIRCSKESHPDLHDASEKDYWTEIMQRVNAAYDYVKSR